MLVEGLIWMHKSLKMGWVGELVVMMFVQGKWHVRSYCARSSFLIYGVQNKMLTAKDFFYRVDKRFVLLNC